MPSESQPSDTGSNGGSTGIHTGEVEPNQHEPIHYEEVNAIDILYPKEKYKYYYNKDLCKETKADGSNVFVRRAGKLVPLTSVFKSQKTAVTETKNKKTAELVYVYDGGKLLTLGGSLTKINPSNSDSVRARVILPIGVPPIVRGDAGLTKTKKVQAVEINEDLAKFALSALQNPESKDVKMPEEKNESIPESKQKPRSVEEKVDTKIEEPKQIVKEKVKKPPKVTKVVPTKRNILDIIAAKLAMSDDESEEKEEEAEESKPLRDESQMVEDGKLVKEDANENELIKEEKDDDKNNKAENTKDCMTQSKDENSDIKRSNESGTTKCGIENKDDLKPEIEIDLDSSKIAEEKETMQKVELCEYEKDDNKTSKNDKSENKLSKMCSTVESELVDGKELAGKKNKTRAGALIVPHKDVNADSCVDEAKKEEGKDCVPVPFSSKDSDHQICIQDTETDRDPGKETSNESEGVKTILPVSEETDKTETSKEEPDSQNSKETSTQTKAEQPGSATEENDSKTRTFKKNMYRFPSLSREMKRLNMNFVNYTMEEVSDYFMFT